MWKICERLRAKPGKSVSGMGGIGKDAHTEQKQTGILKQVGDSSRMKEDKSVRKPCESWRQVESER